LARSSRDGATSVSPIEDDSASAIISGALSSTKGGSSRFQVGPDNPTMASTRPVATR